MTAEDWNAYFSPTDQHRHLGLYCLGVGRQTGTMAPPTDRVLPCYGAVLVGTGSGSLTWAGRAGPARIQSPMLFWLFPGTSHSYAPGRGGWTETWVLFGGMAARAYEEIGYLDRRRPVQPLAADSEVQAVFADLTEAGRTPPHAQVQCAALVHQLVVRARIEGERDRRSPARTSLLARLRSQACAPLSIAGHARSLGVSVAELRTAVREADAQSPKELILQTRMSQAMVLLAETGIAVQRVAAEVGYRDPAYFTRLFSRRVGVSPRTFRHQHARRQVGGSG